MKNIQDNGADVNISCNANFTPLHILAMLPSINTSLTIPIRVIMTSVEYLSRLPSIHFLNIFILVYFVVDYEDIEVNQISNKYKCSCKTKYQFFSHKSDLKIQESMYFNTSLSHSPLIYFLKRSFWQF